MPRRSEKPTKANKPGAAPVRADPGGDAAGDALWVDDLGAWPIPSQSSVVADSVGPSIDSSPADGWAPSSTRRNVNRRETALKSSCSPAARPDQQASPRRQQYVTAQAPVLGHPCSLLVGRRPPDSRLPLPYGRFPIVAPKSVGQRASSFDSSSTCSATGFPATTNRVSKAAT